MNTKYCGLICKELDNLIWFSTEHDSEYRAKLRLFKSDVEIIKMFLFCSEAQYSFSDEQGKENLRSMYTHLGSIWVEQNTLEDFDPVTFGLEGKIQQSKPLIERWCHIMIKCKSDFNRLEKFVVSVFSNVCHLIYTRTAEIAPFKNQIDILTDKVQFMSYSLERVCGCKDSKELLEYRDFVHVFLENAACLVCLYWAKEANDETATEMNILLFDMLHKIKPFAAHVTASYYAILKSNNLLLLSDYNSIYEIGSFKDWLQNPVSFVHFFWEDTILEDVFLILRERLMHLFTFLAQSQEEDVIRTQIYALFHEDSYLLLSINEMKVDVSNNNMLLSDCMIKIDNLTAQIIQFNCRPSDSWNRLEAWKMNNIYFASFQRELSTIKHNKFLSDQERVKVHLHIKEIRFLRLFFQCFETWDDGDEETKVQLRSVVTSLQRIWGQENDMRLFSCRLYATICKEDNIADLVHVLDIELKEKFQMSKQEINAWLISLFHCSFHCRPSTSNEILKFLDYILYNMNDLVSSRPSKDAAFEKQNGILKEKLLLLKNLLNLATNCVDSKNLEELNMLAQDFANNAACLICVYWANEANDDIPAETNLMLTNMLQKIKPDTPDVARAYIGTLKAICLQPYDFILLEETALSFVDYFFEDLIIPWKNDFQIHRDEVMFILSFVHHHHHLTGNAEKIIYRQLDVLFNDGVYGLLPFEYMQADFSKKKVGLTDFMLNIETENAKIRQLYCKFPVSFVYNFPRMIGQEFLFSLIQNLRNLEERTISDQRYVPCAEFKIKTFEEELLALTPIFNQIFELKDLNDAWLEVVNVAYLAGHVISLCHIFYHLIFHYIPYLSDVVDMIKDVRTKLERCDIINSSCLPSSTDLISTPSLQQDQTSEIHGVMVGFEDQETIIINNIMTGSKSLDIVSIVGMGGLGKTTLALKIYGSSSVKSHFNIFAFTYVSQHFDKRRLLLGILKNIAGVDTKTSCMTNDDLAHKLKKCLSRRKYFIVLDDIWDINAWDAVRSSFPDDRNGSRIMLTTRSYEVAKRGQIDCNPHQLRFLSKDESWELLQKKVFHNDVPPPNISSVAKLIAEKCHGLPLAIVVIAGLLARTETSLWIDISKRVSSYLLDDERCINILELSYNQLPVYLKPCFIYLGAFPEDWSYKVRQTTLLWIAEGFIMESKTKSLNDVAKEYLYELVDRSLIIVDKMTIGEIRTFHVHDLIHDFCQKKCRDENFFQVEHGTAASGFSGPYRVSRQNLLDISVDAEQSLANIRSLLYFPPEVDYSERIFPFRKFRFAQVLYLKDRDLQQSDFAHMISLFDLRHIEVKVPLLQSIPSSIANLWNVQSLILMNREEIDLPETLWRMKSLRHVKVNYCKLKVSDGYELNAFPPLDKVVSFSRPCLSSGKDVEWLQQRLPAVRELGCILDYKSLDYIEERVETLNFYRKLESLKLCIQGTCCSYSINFPSTLIKLKLDGFQLSWTDISSIMELQCLSVLKLQYVSFPGTTWEMEDMKFPKLKYLELSDSNLEIWNADTTSFPCLEQLVSFGSALEELPPCFAEISSLKKIIIGGSLKLRSSARQFQLEQLDLGNEVETLTLDD